MTATRWLLSDQMCLFFLETQAKGPREHGLMMGAGIKKCGCQAGQPSFPQSTAMSYHTPAAAEMRRTEQMDRRDRAPAGLVSSQCPLSSRVPWIQLFLGSRRYSPLFRVHPLVTCTNSSVYLILSTKKP